jgi:sodium-independent sulfate anion transporter 11
MHSSPIFIDYEPISYKNEASKLVKTMPKHLKNYISNKLPIIYWIYRYNLTWLVSDIIAGLTVGIVAVPQGMGYAKIANLSAVKTQIFKFFNKLMFDFCSNMDCILLS